MHIPNERKIAKWKGRRGWKGRFVDWLDKYDPCQCYQIFWLIKNLPQTKRNKHFAEYMQVENGAVAGTKYEDKYTIARLDWRDGVLHFKSSSGYWVKRQYDASGNHVYTENSDGYWAKRQYDEHGRLISYEDSDGHRCGTPKEAE